MKTLTLLNKYPILFLVTIDFRGVDRMAVLRTEITTIPAETFETKVIGIPATEWQSMKCWQNALSFACFLILISIISAIVRFAVTVCEGTLAWDSDPHINGRLLEAMARFAYAVAAPYLLFYLPDKVKMKKSSLLKKHGWDGSTPYRVVLEYQIRMD